MQLRVRHEEGGCFDKLSTIGVCVGFWAKHSWFAAPNANEARDRSRAPLPLTLRTFDLATAVSGWEMTYCLRWSGDCSPFHVGYLRFACAFRRHSVATFPAVHKGPAIIVRSAIVGVGSFPPGHDAEAPCGSRRKDPDSRAGSACFRRGPKSSRGFFPSSASADPDGARFRRGSKWGRSLPSSSVSTSTGGCLSDFSLPRVTPFPSSPKTFWRGVAAFIPSRISYNNPVCFSEACAPIRSGFLASDP